MGRKKDIVWRYFHQDKKNDAICDFCSKEFQFTNVNKMKAHIVKCRACPSSVIKLFSKSSRNIKEVDIEKFEDNSISLPSTSIKCNSNLKGFLDKMDSKENVSIFQLLCLLGIYCNKI